MKQVWIEAGFFIVSEGKTYEEEPRLLPARIVTVSDCSATVHPEDWALPWCDSTPDELREARSALGLDDSGLEELRSWVARALDQGRYGWPSVFYELGDAREFLGRFLGSLQRLRIVGLSMARDVATEFVDQEGPPDGKGGSGVWTMLGRKKRLSRRLKPLGFDVLGAEWGGSFHTFSCNSLERELNEELGVTFNEWGLIDDYSKAVMASDHVNRDDVASEPLDWYPVRLDDYPLAEAGPDGNWLRAAAQAVLDRGLRGLGSTA